MTDEQYNALAPFEPNFKTALEVNYSRYPGAAAIDTMFNIHRALTNSRLSLNRSCSVCILNLVKSVGRLYFAEKARRERMEVERMEAELKAKQTEEEKTESKPNKAKKSTKKK